MADYDSEGHVSVWLGSFPDEATFKAYMKETYDEEGDATCPFWTDVGQHLDHDLYESHHEPNGPTSIDKFIEGCSYVESYGTALKKACAEQGIHSARTGIFAYDLAYPADRPFSSPYLKFIGVFAYVRKRWTPSESKRQE